MFPACCFRQITYMTHGIVNGVLNETNIYICVCVCVCVCVYVCV